MPCGRLRFGPAGKPIDLKGDLLKAPAFLRELGLDAMEYEAVRGVNISRERAQKLGQLAREHGVLLSLHAPYYINLSSDKRTTIQASIRRVYESLLASEWMGSYAVVVHPGYYLKYTREQALKMVIDGFKKAWEKAVSDGVRNTWIAPETTGKSKQVGSVDDIIVICSNLEKCRPTVDWAHLYARSEGRFPQSLDDLIKIVERFEKELGSEVVKPLHSHFSRIEYGKGGEREHHTMAEEEYGPDFRMVCRALRETGVDSTIISESPILERDALVMKRICEEECGA